MLYEGPAVAFKPQGPEGPWSGSAYCAHMEAEDMSSVLLINDGYMQQPIIEEN